MTLTIVEDKSVWDSFIDASQSGTLFHKWDFLKIIEKYSGCKLFRYGFYKGNKLTCVFPVLYKTKMTLTMAFSPPPGTGIPYLGPVMGHVYDSAKQHKKEVYLNSIVEEIGAEFKKYSINYVAIRTVPGFLDSRAFIWKDYDVDLNYTYIIDLQRPLEEIWNGFDHTCKKIIKTQEKESLIIKEEKDASSIDDITKKRDELMIRRLDEVGLPFHFPAPSYLKEIIEAYPENMKLYCAYDKNNELKGIDVVYMYKSNFMQFVGGIKGHLNECLTYEFIKMAKAAGYKTFENWDANTRRLSTYKSKYNFSLHIGFNIKKKDNISKIAEWTYLRLPVHIKL
jgi:hypothetical protein